MIIDCAFDSKWWAPPDELEKLSVAAIEAAGRHIDPPLDTNSEVSLLFTNDEQVKTLNSQWRQQNKATNVLSFASREGPGPQTPVLGDIVLAFQTIARESREQNKLQNDHLSHLIVHGFLHLLGHDHENEAQARDMETLETTILASLGIADPYATR